MPKCIFCLTTDKNVFNTKEHILPESLGGGDWAILPDGLYCDKCQNIFGSSIEQQALADYPFINLRTLLGIPTKKNKAPWFDYMEGRLHSAGEPGRIIYEPNEYFKKAFVEGRKTLTIIPAMTRKSNMVLRTLLKIGLETIAGDNGENKVFEERFDPARIYALTGQKKYDWPYLLIEHTDKLNLYIKGIAADEEPFFMDIYDYDKEQEYLHLRVLYLDFFVPLIENVVIDPEILIGLPRKTEIIIV
ncbi:MAG: HNH endonuclease [Bacteroidia bacterium]|nr:HNH endonuclease [Bacteroidia bacterium]